MPFLDDRARGLPVSALSFPPPPSQPAPPASFSDKGSQAGGAEREGEAAQALGGSMSEGVTVPAAAAPAATGAAHCMMAVVQVLVWDTARHSCAEPSTHSAGGGHVVVQTLI